MKIGDKVIITNFKPLPVLIGMTGVIVEEKITSSQVAMIRGNAPTTWIVRLDTPVTYNGETFDKCLVREQCLQAYEVLV